MPRIKRYQPELETSDEPDYYGSEPFLSVHEEANGEYVEYEDHKQVVLRLLGIIRKLRARLAARGRDLAEERTKK
jgi:hypothetical protein